MCTQHCLSSCKHAEHTRRGLAVQVLQNLEAALSPQSSSVEQASLVSTLQARINAAEAAGICYPLVRAAAVRLRMLQATDAHASLESALNHQNTSVAVAMQLSMLRSSLERAQELLASRELVQYVTACHMQQPPPGLPMFQAIEDAAAAAEAPTQGNSCAAAGSGPAVDVDRGQEVSRPSTAGDSGTDEAAGAPGKARKGSKGGLKGSSSGRALSESGAAPGDGELRRRAIAAGVVFRQPMAEEEASALVAGVDMAELTSLAERSDALLVLVGRALTDMAKLEAEVKRIEAEKAEAVRTPVCSFQGTARAMCLMEAISVRFMAAAQPWAAAAGYTNGTHRPCCVYMY